MSADKNSKAYTAGLTLSALGIVLGDIGTSPLYAIQQCLLNLHARPAAPAEILGVLSLVFWSIVLVVCVKYVTFLLRCDHHGEGGTLAMLALIKAHLPPKKSLPGALALTVLFGSALLYGDGIITPSISVLSAVEGIKVARPAAQRYVVPIATAILVALFLVQRRGTAGIGAFFGPIMGAWFLAIGALGIAGVFQVPAVLAAGNPWAAVRFLGVYGWQGVVVLGGVVLCFSGAEALFADLALFGRLPIRLAWYGLVLPALLLNYFGQGAWLLKQPDATSAPFYGLVPPWALYPMVVLSTAATVIASQALISGVFSLTQQAIHMGYCPRLAVMHTSREERGQIYIGAVNYALMLGCIGIVLGFRSSDRLGSAYGLAIVGTMCVTSLTYYAVLRKVRDWSFLRASLLAGAFLLMDSAFLAGNIVKIFSGAWVPLLIAGLVFGVFWVWTQGNVRYENALAGWALPVDDFCREITGWKTRHEGTGVLVTGHPEAVPLMKKQAWLRLHARHEQILLVSLSNQNLPYVSEEETGRVEPLGPSFYRVTGAYGFMQQPDVSRLLECQRGKLPIKMDNLVCYLPTPAFVSHGGWWTSTLLGVYNFLGRNSLSAEDYLCLRTLQVIHVDVSLEV